ncbi:Flp pilus assembly protein RcpC/CpaB [Candidatus Rhodobacter oscarellae]|uniref:Flp pilus assembly protein RcpC/CpaB n=1 Tax=Candidatus Rhodobacter oscarellae TaxID=1675527 RepID=A0A0J9H1A0_9RHOB|nr:Flp pilus assembly protein CpaB [Candidatus Rhodobacter lobularis]KMW59523.1 Flp pilus assembly protein RcpC/CpaB [Candidatus Rhodobacter lobularis]
MRLVFGLVLVIGVGLASFAVYMAKDYISAYQAELARERAAREAIVPTVDVVVVSNPLRYGQAITDADVRVVKWPENAIPEGTFTSLEEVFPFGADKPRKAIRAVEKDEALMAVKVTEPGQDAGVSSRLTKGMRAFAIRVDVSTGVSGFLRPGDRVDVYWTGAVQQERNRGGDVTQLIQSGIKLIAIDQIADQDKSNPTIARTVTVEASPQQVAALAQAQATGSLSLSLLGAEDDAFKGDVVVNQNGLLGIVEEQVVEVEAKRVCTIRTRRGSEIIETPIPCTN